MPRHQFCDWANLLTAIKGEGCHRALLETLRASLYHVDEYHTLHTLRVHSPLPRSIDPQPANEVIPASCSTMAAAASSLSLLRTKLGFSGTAGLWKFLALLFALLNLKSLPLAWHVSLASSSPQSSVLTY